MKNVFFLFTLFLMGCIASCNLFSESEKPKTELDKLPSKTTTGENTFGCLVNGKAFVVKSASRQVAIFQQGQLQLGANIEAGGIDKSISLNLIDPLHIGTGYPIDNKDYYGGYTFKSENITCVYGFENTFDGLISFSKIDRTNFIIAGTFEFSTVTSGCDTIRITQGRFDLQYIP